MFIFCNEHCWQTALSVHGMKSYLMPHMRMYMVGFGQCILQLNEHSNLKLLFLDGHLLDVGVGGTKTKETPYHTCLIGPYN